MLFQGLYSHSRVGFGGFQTLAGRVGSGQKVLEISGVGSGGVRSGQVGPGDIPIPMAGWPGLVTLAQPDPTRKN